MKCGCDSRTLSQAGLATKTPSADVKWNVRIAAAVRKVTAVPTIELKKTARGKTAGS